MLPAHSREGAVSGSGRSDKRWRAIVMLRTMGIGVGVAVAGCACALAADTAPVARDGRLFEMRRGLRWSR